MLEVQNNNTGTDDTALSLKLQPGGPPMTVNSTAHVPLLNADLVDGKARLSSWGRSPTDQRLLRMRARCWGTGAG